MSASPELAVSYAALILQDDKIPITVENLEKVLSAAGVKVPAFWPRIFAKTLGSRNVDDLLMSVGSSGASAAPVAAPTATAAPTSTAAPAETKKPEPAKPAKKVDSEEDAGGFGLFD